MSAENIAVVRAIHEALAEQRSPGHLIHDEIEYVNPPYALEAGTKRGREVLDRVRDVYPDFRLEPERYLEVGDDVVVIGVARGTTASGVEAQWRQGYVWTVRDGVAVRLRWFNDPREALEAAGLDPNA